MREIEVKYRVEDTEALLVALKSRGIELSEPVFQDDQAYAPAGWQFGDSKLGVSFLRLRTVAGRQKPAAWPGKQVLLVLAYLRMGETLAELLAGCSADQITSCPSSCRATGSEWAMAAFCGSSGDSCCRAGPGR